MRSLSAISSLPWAAAPGQRIADWISELQTELRAVPRPDVRSQLRETAVCAVAASAFWLVCFFYAANIRYIGDDFTVLRPVVIGDSAQSIHTFIRLLEFAAALGSKLLDFPLWLVVSFLAYIGTALATASLLRITTNENRIPVWQLIVCAATPLAANTYFQVDTVSQSLANLFSLFLAIASLACVRAANDSSTKLGWIVAALSMCCMLSKETSYGLIGFACLLIFATHKRRVFLPVALSLVLLTACLFMSVLSADVTPGAHYGLKGPHYWIFGIAFSLLTAIAPVPTSVVMTGTATLHPVLLATVLVGALVLLVSVISLGFWIIAQRRSPVRRDNAPRGVHAITGVLLGFVFFSLTPSLFFKVSELYASQCLPFLKCLLLRIRISRIGKWVPMLWLITAVLWLVASEVNVMFYSIRSGYRVPDSDAHSILMRPLIALETIVPQQRRNYSIYSWQNKIETRGHCRVSREEPDICLPKNIASGFPQRIEQ